MKLHTIELKDFHQVYELMSEAFPRNEIRSYQGQLQLLSHPNYKMHAAKNNDEVMAMIATWRFESFLFIEHLAVSSNYRNQGLGNKALDIIESMTDTKIILEVEYPTTHYSIKRIQFYERRGYKLQDFNYEMPSLIKGEPPLPLLIMSKDILSKEDFKLFYDHMVNIINLPEEIKKD